MRLLILFIVLFLQQSILAQDVLVIRDEKKGRGAEGTSGPLTEEDMARLSQVGFRLFYEKWRDFESAFKDGDPEKEEKALKQILALRSQYSLPKLTEFAVGLIQHGKEELSRNRLDAALHLFETAARLDPSLPYAYYSEAKVHLTKGIRGIGPAGAACLDGFLAPLHTPAGRMYFYSKYMLILWITLLSLGFCYALVLFVKYNHLFRHEIVEMLGSSRPGLTNFLAWGLLFLPLFLLLGPFWLAPYWMMIFWPHTRLSEKALSFLFFLLIAAGFPGYRWVLDSSRTSSDPSIASYISVFSEGATMKSISDFEKYALQNPTNSDASIMLANLYKTDRRLTSATEILQKHLASHPDDPRGYNNLAVIFFLQGETDTPLRLAQKASDLDSRNPIYPYNLSKLQRAKFNFSEAQRFLDIARSLDPVMVETLEASPQERLVDAIPTEQMIWQKFKKENPNKASLIQNPFSFLTIGFLIGAMLFGFRKRKNPAHECIKCGKAFCRKCQPSNKDYPFCIQCLHIFVRKDGVSSLSRKDKMDEIEQHARRQGLFLRLSSLVMPGAGSIYRDQTLSGVLLLLFWLLPLALLVFNWKFANISYLEPAEGIKILTPFLIFVLALVYLLANVPQLVKSKSPG